MTAHTLKDQLQNAKTYSEFDSLRDKYWGLWSSLTITEREELNKVAHKLAKLLQT